MALEFKNTFKCKIKSKPPFLFEVPKEIENLYYDHDLECELRGIGEEGRYWRNPKYHYEDDWIDPHNL